VHWSYDYSGLAFALDGGTDFAGNNTPASAYFWISTSGNFISGGTAWALTLQNFNENHDLVENVLSKVLQLSPVLSREYDDNNSPTNKSYYGFVAQEVDLLFPELIRKGVQDKLFLNYDGINALTVRAIQEQQEIIDKQGKDIQALMVRVEALEAKN
jgi:hypothetical protein